MIEVQYKIQVTNTNWLRYYKLFISRVVSSFSSEFAMNLSFLSVTTIGSKMFYKKGDGRFVILLVKYFSGIGGATAPDSASLQTKQLGACFKALKECVPHLNRDKIE